MCHLPHLLFVYPSSCWDSANHVLITKCGIVWAYRGLVTPQFLVEGWRRESKRREWGRVHPTTRALQTDQGPPLLSVHHGFWSPHPTFSPHPTLELRASLLHPRHAAQTRGCDRPSWGALAASGWTVSIIRKSWYPSGIKGTFRSEVSTREDLHTSSLPPFVFIPTEPSPSVPLLIFSWLCFPP